jgi:L-alanine-DL-glutamate epimerase-like enolase superfamily enzyme
MHDAPRIGGITPFLKVAGLAQSRGMIMAPHFVMEIHLHLAAAYEQQAWVEHFEWLEPLFNERLDIRDGKMRVPDRPGLGLSLHEQIAGWTLAQSEIGKRP